MATLMLVLLRLVLLDVRPDAAAYQALASGSTLADLSMED
jgi:hypothetical protein